MTEQKTNMPAKPFVGLVFRPDTTDALGIITNVQNSKSGATVEYRFKHDGLPENAPRYSRPYSEVRRMAHYMGKNDVPVLTR